MANRLEFTRGRKEHTLSAFRAQFQQQLPKIVCVAQGYRGEDSRNTFDPEQILRFDKIAESKRAVVRAIVKGRNATLSIPAKYAINFRVVKRHFGISAKVRKEHDLQEILRKHALPVHVEFASEGERKVKIDHRYHYVRDFQDIEIVDTYSVHHLLGNILENGSLNPEFFVLPVNLEGMKVSMVTGVLGYTSSEEWKTYCKDLDEQVKTHIKFEGEFDNKDIEVYLMESDNPAPMNTANPPDQGDTIQSSSLCLPSNPSQTSKTNPLKPSSSAIYTNQTSSFVEEPPTRESSAIYCNVGSVASRETDDKLSPSSHRSSPVSQSPVPVPEYDPGVRSVPRPPSDPIYEFIPPVPDRAPIDQTNDIVTSDTGIEDTHSYTNTNMMGVVKPIMSITGMMSKPKPSTSADVSVPSKAPGKQKPSVMPKPKASRPGDQSPSPSSDSQNAAVVTEVNKQPAVHSGDDTSKLNIMDLTVEGVADCMRMLKLDQHVLKFKEDDIDGEMLLELEEEVLKNEYQFTFVEGRRLLKYIKKGYIPRHG